MVLCLSAGTRGCGACACASAHQLGAITGLTASAGALTPVPNEATHAMGRPGKSTRASCSAIAAGLLASSAPSWNVDACSANSGKYVGAAVVARSACHAGAWQSPQ